jgi:hypothetical protein
MSIEDTFEELKSRLETLNSGLLNPDKAPSHLDITQCISLGVLSVELGAVVDDLKASAKTESDIRSALNSIKDIERRAKGIAYG